MRQIIQTSERQGNLFGVYLMDFLPKGHKVFLLEELLKGLDLSKIRKRYKNTGGAYHDPVRVLSVIFYGYSEGIYSSRKLEKATCDTIPFMYLAGGNSISYRSICYFIEKFQDELEELFLGAVLLGKKIGLFTGLSRFSLDGTKIKSNASDKQSSCKADLEKNLRALRGELSGYLSKLKESCENDTEAPEVDVEKALSKLKELSEEEKELKVKAHKAGKISKTLSANRDAPVSKKLNTTDPESRFMKNRGKLTQSYNAQAVSSNQFIVAKDVTNGENDQKQLEPMLEQTEKNIELDKEPSCVETSSDKNSSGSGSGKPILLADAGYNSGPNLSHTQISSFDSYIAMNERKNESETVGDNEGNGNKENHYSNEDFDYNDENDTWICPQGEELENYGEKIQEGKHITMYTGKLEACLQCPSRTICLTTKLDQKNGYRSVVDDGHNISRKKMKEKMALPEAQEIYKQRAIDVEPVFGQIKYNRNFMRFSARGLSKVKTQFTLVCIAHNLSKIIQYMRENPEKLAEIYQKIADLIFALKILLKIQPLQPKLAS